MDMLDELALEIKRLEAEIASLCEAAAHERGRCYGIAMDYGRTHGPSSYEDVGGQASLKTAEAIAALIDQENPTPAPRLDEGETQ